MMKTLVNGIIESRILKLVILVKFYLLLYLFIFIILLKSLLIGELGVSKLSHVTL